MAFAKLLYTKPHILLLDEPTNHLDLDSVDALIQALLPYQGGVLLVSHDEHFISAVCDDLWVVDKCTVAPFPGDFFQYKETIAKKSAGKAKITL